MANYISYPDGTVVAWGREEGGESNLWIASAWSAHPVLDTGAVHLGHLCVDAEWPQLRAALDAWAEEHGRVQNTYNPPG